MNHVTWMRIYLLQVMRSCTLNENARPHAYAPFSMNVARV